MIPYFDGKRDPARSLFPLRIQPGDILCLAGANPTVKPPFEHVAVVAEPYDLRSAADLIRVHFYGFDESFKGPIPVLQKGSYWFSNPAFVSKRIGCFLSVWNIVGRAIGPLDEMAAQSDALRMAGLVLEARPRMATPSRFKLIEVHQRHDPSEATNCLGWVCSVLKWMWNREIFSADPFPQYESPYSGALFSGLRNFPSAGHLFDYLSDTKTGRYVPPVRELAARAAAKWTLAELSAGRR